MSDTTGLKVFDPEGMYRSETLLMSGSNAIAESVQTKRVVDERTVLAAAFGEIPHLETIRDAITMDGEEFLRAANPDLAAKACMQPVSAATLPFATLDELETMLDAHPAGLTKAYAQWLVRVCKASDARVIELENQLKTKQADFNGMISEWHDLADENRRLKQQAEVDKLVCESQERTVIELRAQVDSLTRSDVLAT